MPKQITDKEVLDEKAIGETQKEAKDIPYFEKYIVLKKELKNILDSF